MYLLDTGRKFAIGVVFIILLVDGIMGFTGRATGDDKTIEKGNYMLTVVRESEDSMRIIRDSEGKVIKVACNGLRKKTSEEIFGFRMSIEEELLEDLLDNFDKNLYTGDPAKDHAKLRTLILTEIGISDRPLSSKVSLEIDVKPLPCYTRKAFLRYKRDRFTVKTERRRTFKAPLVSEFHWDEYSDRHIMLETKYDEACEGCEIPEKQKPVTGPGNQQLWVYIKYEHQEEYPEEYVIPLYWGNDHKIVPLIPLLPDEIEPDVIDSLSR
jgi:hypothetical protein